MVQLLVAINIQDIKAIIKVNIVTMASANKLSTVITIL